MMQFKRMFNIDFINYYILLLSVLIFDNTKIFANAYNQNYEDSTNIQSSQSIKPVGGYGHPKFTPRYTEEQINLPNPYLVNGGNPESNQINCEGANCEEPSYVHNVDQIYHPYNYIQQTLTNSRNKNIVYNNDNILPYGDISNANSMIDRQQNLIGQQSYQQNIEDEINLPTSSYQNNFFNPNQQNTFNQEPNQQQQTYGNQMENSNYKNVVPHVSNNNVVDINLILEQQNEHLRVLLHNIKQQQLKIMQTIMDIQYYVETIPTRIKDIGQ